MKEHSCYEGEFPLQIWMLRVAFFISAVFILFYFIFLILSFQELAVMVARSRDGMTRSFPVVETTHK